MPYSYIDKNGQIKSLTSGPVEFSGYADLGWIRLPVHPDILMSQIKIGWYAQIGRWEAIKRTYEDREITLEDGRIAVQQVGVDESIWYTGIAAVHREPQSEIVCRIINGEAYIAQKNHSELFGLIR